MGGGGVWWGGGGERERLRGEREREWDRDKEMKGGREDRGAGGRVGRERGYVGGVKQQVQLRRHVSQAVAEDLREREDGGFKELLRLK